MVFDSLKLRISQIKDQKIRDLLNNAMEMPLDQSVIEVQSEFGISCLASYAFPGIIYNLRKHLQGKQISDVEKLYLDMIRTNILCGGDSCARGIVIGSILGILFGTPEKLYERVNLEFRNQV